MPLMYRFHTRAIAFLFCFMLAISGVTGAKEKDKPIDFSKLKPGAALEIRRGFEWEPATFVEYKGGGLVYVREKEFPQPVPMPLSFVRLAPKRAKAKGEAAGENPFATDDELAAARKPRTWSDQSGSFKVEAIFLSVKDEKVVLRRADKKEISVPLERLSQADQEYVASLTGEDNLPAADAPDEAAGEEAEKPEFPITKTSLGPAPLVELSTAEWTYRPDLAEKQSPLRNLRIPLKATHLFERPQRLLLSPIEKRAFLVTHNMSEGHFGVVAIDMQRGEGGELSVFSKSSAPIAASADGKYVLGRSQAVGPGGSAILTLFGRQGLKVKPEKSWVPYEHHGAHQSRTWKNYYNHGADVTWADFLDASHVATLSEAGELVLWNLADLKPLYQAKLPERGGQPALSGGRKYLAAASEKSVIILQAADGKLAGRLAIDSSRGGDHLAFSPDGAKLAMHSADARLRVWDLGTQKLERDFSTISTDKVPHHIAREITWVNNDYLLVGTRLIDVQRRCSVADYSGMYPWIDYGDRVYFVADAHRAPTFTSAQLPTPDIREKWASISPDDLLVIKPGMEVAVELSTADQYTAEARERIVKSLTEGGLKVVPQSDIKLIGTIGPGESKEVTYSTTGGLFNRNDTTVNVQGRVLTLSFSVKGEVVWTYRTATSASHFVHMKKGESVGQAAQKAAELDSRAFQNVWIPVTVARPPKELQLVPSDYPAS